MYTIVDHKSFIEMLYVSNPIESLNVEAILFFLMSFKLFVDILQENQ